METPDLLEDCSICLDPMLKEIAVLSCHHEYHLKCISDWIIRSKLNKISNYKCPICNNDTFEINLIYNKDGNYDYLSGKLVLEQIEKYEIEKYEIERNINYNQINRPIHQVEVVNPNIIYNPILPPNPSRWKRFKNCIKKYYFKCLIFC